MFNNNIRANSKTVFGFKKKVKYRCLIRVIGHTPSVYLITMITKVITTYRVDMKSVISAKYIGIFSRYDTISICIIMCISRIAVRVPIEAIFSIHIITTRRLYLKSEVVTTIRVVNIKDGFVVGMTLVFNII